MNEDISQRLTTALFFENGFEEGPETEYVGFGLESLVHSGSDFGNINRDFLDKGSKDLEDLRDSGYEIMLTYLDEEIIGHVAFQKHEDQEHGKNWQVFHIYLIEKYRGKNIPFFQAIRLIEYAREKGIEHVRLSKGKHKVVRKYAQKLHDVQYGLGFRIDLDTHWMQLV